MHHLVGSADKAQAVERGAKALRVSLSDRGGLVHLWSMLLLLYRHIVLDRCSTSLSSPTSSNVASPTLRLLATSSTLTVSTSSLWVDSHRTVCGNVSDSTTGVTNCSSLPSALWLPLLSSMLNHTDLCWGSPPSSTTASSASLRSTRCLIYCPSTIVGHRQQFQM